MATTALGAAPDDAGNGLDPLTHRQIIRRHWVNTGVVGGLTVSGRTDLFYQVAAGMAVCSMGDSDGYTEAFWPGGATATAVSAGDTTYSRIDTVYILANTGTPDNLIHVDVVQGTPSASPVKPTLPSGAIPIMSRLMPASGSNTNASSQYDASMTYAIPNGAQLDRVGYGRNTSTLAQDWTKGKWWGQAPCTVPQMATDRNVTVRFMGRASVDGDTPSSYYARLVVDGTPLTDGSDECPVLSVWMRWPIEFPTTLTAGTQHTVDVEISPNTNRKQFTWRGLRYVEVIDRGPAQ